MKRILILCITSLSLLGLATNPTVNPKPILDSLGRHVNKATSTVYGDTKEVISTLYGDSKVLLEKGAVRLDTLLTNGYKQLSKGAGHTFEVMKRQQLVKSIHHTFYWLAGIIALLVFLSSVKQLLGSENSTQHANFMKIRTVISLVLFVVLTIININNFMELWTGYMNPEYGVYLEIMHYLGK